jgi:hypothetical protein
MAHKNDILTELREISEMVAGLPNQVPFSVPPGYFVGFAEKMLDIVRQSAELPIGVSVSVLPSHLKDLPTFQAPAGYFDGLAESILRRIKSTSMEGSVGESTIGETLSTPAFLSGLKDRPTFRVPEGYFSHLPERMVDMAMASGAEENAQEEISRLSPLLASVGRSYPAWVPTGYFEGWVIPKEETVAPMEAIVVPLGSRTKGTVVSLRRFLAAAVTIGAVLLSAVWGSYIYDKPAPFRSGINIKTQDQFNTAMAKVTDQDILDYLKNNSDVSDADLMASEVDDQPSPAVDDFPDGTLHPDAQGATKDHPVEQ